MSDTPGLILLGEQFHFTFQFSCLGCELCRCKRRVTDDCVLIRSDVCNIFGDFPVLRLTFCL